MTASISRFWTAATAIRKAERAKELRSLAAACISLCNCSLSPNQRYLAIFFNFFNARFLAASVFFFFLTLGFS